MKGGKEGGREKERRREGSTEGEGVREREGEKELICLHVVIFSHLSDVVDIVFSVLSTFCVHDLLGFGIIFSTANNQSCLW